MRMCVYFHLPVLLVVFKLCNRARAWKEVKKFIIWKLFKREDRQRASLEGYCIRRDPSLCLFESKIFRFFSRERYRDARVLSPYERERERRRPKKSEKKVVFQKCAPCKASDSKKKQKKWAVTKRRKETHPSWECLETINSQSFSYFSFFARDFVLVCGFVLSGFLRGVCAPLVSFWYTYRHFYLLTQKAA
jgi:hypothetical protein